MKRIKNSSFERSVSRETREPKPRTRRLYIIRRVWNLAEKMKSERDISHNDFRLDVALEKTADIFSCLNICRRDIFIGSSAKQSSNVHFKCVQCALTLTNLVYEYVHDYSYGRTKNINIYSYLWSNRVYIYVCLCVYIICKWKCNNCTGSVVYSTIVATEFDHNFMRLFKREFRDRIFIYIVSSNFQNIIFCLIDR